MLAVLLNIGTPTPAKAAEVHITPSVVTVTMTTVTPAKVSTTAQSATSCIVTVQRGQWLSRIAPANWRAVAAFNHIANPSRIFPGERINVCVSSSQQQPQGKQFTAMIPANVGGTAAAHASTTQSTVTSPVSVNHASGRTYRNLGTPGYCTWYVQDQRPDIYIPSTQSAADFGRAAASVGDAVGYTPRVGAIVVFQRGVDGASPTYGHVAIVQGISGNSIVIREMNGTAGFGRVDVRTVPLVAGISFIY